LLGGPGPGRIEHHRVEAGQLRCIERAAVQVAVLGRDRRRRAFERQHCVA